MLEETAHRQRRFLRAAFFCISGALILPFLALRLAESYRAGRPGLDKSDDLSYAQVKPATDDLLGNWIPDQATVKALQQKGAGPYADGRLPVIALGKQRYVMRGVPYWGVRGGPRQLIASGEGSWSMHRERGAWTVYMHVGEVEATGFVVGEKPNYKLKVVLGDETFNQPLTFERLGKAE